MSGLGEFPAVGLDAISMPLFGGEYRVASLDSLIRSKRAAGRNKDLNVLPELEALKEMHAQKEHPERKNKCEDYQNADFFERKKYFFAFVRQRVAEILNSCL